MSETADNALHAFSRLLGRSPDAYLLLRSEGQVVVECNIAAATLLGSTREALIGRDLSAIVSERDAWEEFLLLASRSRDPLPGSLRLHPLGNQEIALRADAQAVAETRPALLLVRLRDTREAHRDFSILTERVEQLVAEVNLRRRMEEQQRLLVEELNHRVMNMLSTVQGMVRQTLKGSEVPQETLNLIDARIASLAQGHRLVARTSWSTINIDQLASAILMPLDAGTGRILLDGPECQLRPNQAIALAMAFHELASNAAKYGALSNLSGRVHVEWRLIEDGKTFRIGWSETGGPHVMPPNRSGFGSRLIARNLPAELSGKARLEYLAEGLRYTIEFPYQ